MIDQRRYAQGAMIGAAAMAVVFMVAAAGGGCAGGGEGEGGAAHSTAVGGSSGGGVGGGGVGGGAAGGGGGVAGGGGGGGCLSPDGPVLAWDAMFLGDTDYQHNPDPTAWQQYGFDIDGLSTAGDFSAHCLPNNGAAPSTVFPDGPGGMDNSFGKNVLPALLNLNPNLSTQANQAIHSGQFTLIMLFEGLSGADADPLTTKLWGGASLVPAPAWDGSDCWPVRPEDLTDPGDIATAKVQFPNSRVLADHFESVDTSTLLVPITFAGSSFEVRILKARMEATLAPSHKGAALGIVGGVLDTEQFVEAVRDAMGSIDSSFCQGGTFDNVALQVRQASDIMKDGSQNPTAVCDGISVGLGYTMLAVGLGPVAPPEPPPVDPCP